MEDDAGEHWFENRWKVDYDNTSEESLRCDYINFIRKVRFRIQ